MIIDEMIHLNRYAGLSGRFARAARFLRETDLNALPCGRVEIDGDYVYGILSENMTEAGERPYEAHARYADIQVILQGSERFVLGLDPRLEALDTSRDFRGCQSDHPIPFTLTPGQFVIFLPGEAHAPGGAAGEPGLCRKLVVKVLFE